ncbi:predicted protein [Micromonas commoda]|uniref:Ribonuclease n=1 Tax=Micromonas commoda (strain RCC299 / NOUM17 / CCMP2709) TaxID=296587 RepID=C1EET3_MICCC|nr:predicted protein [Micromonas commoda]ACO66294.1 predicted protein [Micromonas commoda]|eukprot:XP_002505036.1 predicted protein [Micromonas commoda]
MAHGSGWMHGLVKAVPSGDCVVVMGNAAQGGPPPEKTITLASLVAPRMARRDGRDEPFAFASREFLRRLLIGKQVKFRVEYAVQSIGREFGQVYVGDVNAAVESVANGWAKVRVGGGDQASNHEDLVAAESAAQAAAIGVWTKDPTQLATAVRIVPHAFDPNSLLPTMKGRPVPCVVEAVLNGAALRVQLMTDGTETRHATCVVFLAGVQAPAMKSSRRNHLSDDAGAGGDATSAATDAPNGAADAKPEPFAREAKHFTEVRLLNRDVHIVPEGTDKYDNLFCTVRIPGDGADLAEALAGNGLARCVDWSLSMITAGASKLRAAEKAAKAHRRCVWRDYVAPPPNPNSLVGKNFVGVVVEAASGDSIVVADAETGVERRVTLSSIRAPKLGNERRGIKPEPWAHEAKEFLRVRCVGKSVKVSMEYVRKIPTANGGTAGGAGAEAPGITLEMGTVMLPTDQLKGEDGSAATNDTGVAELNVAEMLVLRGLATVVRHRNDDDERSLRYDDLVQAEQRAIKGKKGVQNKDKPAPVHHVNDVSTNAQKSRQILPFLQRAGRSHAIVDYVLSGHRLKLSVPKEGAIVAFAIAGVRCPRGDEPGAAEAYRFVRHTLCQRDCEIEVEAVDKVGTFLGTLTYGKGNAKAPTVLNLGVELLRRGLGTLHDSYDPRGRANGEALVLAQDAAKSARVGLCELGVTEVVGAGRFFCQRATGGDRAAWLHSQLQTLSPNVSRVGFEPRKGTLVAGRFTGDDEWYRAVVTSVEGQRGTANETYAVHYRDFGNGERLPRERLAPLPPELASTPPLAHLCVLSHVAIAAGERSRDAEALFASLVSGGGAMDARIDRRLRAPDAPWDPDASPEWHGAESDQSVNAAMVAAGLARVDRRSAKDPSATHLLDAQERARRERRGMWEYGDVDSDDDEEERPKAPGAWGRRR